MRARTVIIFIAVSLFVLGISVSAYAQQPQIPTLQVCNKSAVEGKAVVKIESRSDAIHGGTFTVVIEMKCDPTGMPYPDGSLMIHVDMNDSIVQGTISGVDFEQLTTTGKHSPTVYLSGRCKAEKAPGCRFWMTIADNNQNGKTPDVIGFLVFNGSGQRVAYGTGAVVEGDISIMPTSY